MAFSMVTYLGNRIDPTKLSPEDIDIEDVAHSLSQICRFAGHTRTHYSVAQHSVLLSLLDDLPWHLQKAALLHDASEAYMGDVPRPIKQILSGYKEVEDKIQSVIGVHFG